MRALDLHTNVHIGDITFASDKGSVQGGKLNPFLFNIYLDSALVSSPYLKKLKEGGRLLAFADDLLVRLKGTMELKQVLDALWSLPLVSS
jgi:hypothetical protein